MYTISVTPCDPPFYMNVTGFKFLFIFFSIFNLQDFFFSEFLFDIELNK